MDTLPLAIVPPANTPSSSSSSTFAVQQHPHPSPTIENSSTSSVAHSDGVWVAPPEQQARQQSQVSLSFSHLQPQRPATNFVGPPQTRLNGEIRKKSKYYFMVSISRSR